MSEAISAYRHVAASLKLREIERMKWQAFLRRSLKEEPFRQHKPKHH